ncbi:MAG: hypothetical protein HQK56_17245 [Deltaproteobacteria bacterium]|nr:hypothetical protein [Deltaproteobacteria bacterium]
MQDEEIVQRLLNGASLRTFMIPDPLIPSNYPEHWETYDLPHVILNGNYFWAKTRNEHLYINYVPEITIGLNAFCYTNIRDFFCSIEVSSGEKGLLSESYNTCIMDKTRYRKHLWRLADNYQLIWDSEENNSPELLFEGIRSGLRFKIAMLDSEGAWNIHPVCIPAFGPGPDEFHLYTPWDIYPAFFRSVNETTKAFDLCKEIITTRNDDNQALAEKFKVMPFASFYHIFHDGKFMTLNDVLQGSFRRYQRLRVFVERIST